MTVTEFIESRSRQVWAQRFRQSAPSAVRRFTVSASPLAVENPAQAGREFSRLCERMADCEPLEWRYGRFLPWLRPLRNHIREHDVERIDAERVVGGVAGTLRGKIDLVPWGRDAMVIECKLVSKGAVLIANAVHTAQLACYCHAVLNETGRRQRDLKPVLAYIELETPAVTWIEFDSAAAVVEPVLDLIKEAA